MQNERLHKLLNAAKPFVEAKPSKSAAIKASARPGDASPPDVARAVDAVRFSIAKGLLDLGDYDSWTRVAMAFKHSFGDQGYTAFLELSRDSSNFESEENCRKHWDGIKGPASGAPLTIASIFAEAKQAGWRYSSDSAARDGRTQGTGLPKGVSPAAFTVDLVNEFGDEFWTDREGKPTVSFEVTIPDGRSIKRHSPVSGPLYLQLLKKRFFEATGNNVLTADQGKLVIGLLEFRALETGTEYPAAMRVGEHDGRTYADLGTVDGSAAEIDALGWRIVNEPPVRFIRGSRGAMAMPEPGGSLDDFRRHFNLSEADLQRLVGFLIGTFNTRGSFAILMTDGQQGSGKSMLNDKALALVDPPRQHKDGRMSFNPKEQDLHLAALGVRVLYFDNVSSFTAESADMLCRLSTGGSSGSRRLYTDNEFVQLSVTRPVILTCIGAPTSRADLLSRSIQITALPLEGGRRSEESVMRAFDRDCGKMIGFILTGVSAALRNRADVEDAVERGDIKLPRMADFAGWVEGAAEHLGLAQGEFSELVEVGQSRSQTESVLGSPLGRALVEHSSKSPPPLLEGTASEILALLKPDDLADRYWPAPNKLASQLNRLAVGLRGFGIEFQISEPEGHDNVARFRFSFNSTAASKAGPPDPF